MIVCPLLLAAFVCGVQARAESKGQTAEAAEHFSQRFYAWYVPVALRAAANLQSAWTVAVKDRGFVFSRGLRRALIEDEETQDKVTGHIVGLDWDPFLSTQDPCQRYEVGGATQSNSHYFVSVYGVCSGKREEKPDVIAELAFENGAWAFVNFHYPGNGLDLLRALQLLSTGRHKSKRSTLIAIVPRPEHLRSPRAVVKQYCALDMKGARLSSQNSYSDAIFALADWPEEPGWDSVTIVAGCKVQLVQIGKLRSEVSMQYAVLGTMSGSSVVRAVNHSEVVTFDLENSNGEWKISGPMIRPHVSVDAAVGALRWLLHNQPASQNINSLHKAIATLRAWE